MIVTAVEGRSPGQYVAFYRNLNNLDWHRGWESGGFSNDAANLRQIHPGTLVVDIYDSSTGKLIWRGTAATSPNEKLEQAEVDKEVNTMFAHFPPKSGGPMGPNQTEVPPSPSSEPGINSPPNERKGRCWPVTSGLPTTHLLCCCCLGLCRAWWRRH
jgi:hypothetical protein